MASLIYIFICKHRPHPPMLVFRKWVSQMSQWLSKNTILKPMLGGYLLLKHQQKLQFRYIIDPMPSVSWLGVHFPAWPLHDCCHDWWEWLLSWTRSLHTHEKMTRKYVESCWNETLRRMHVTDHVTIVTHICSRRTIGGYYSILA